MTKQPQPASNAPKVGASKTQWRQWAKGTRHNLDTAAISKKICKHLSAYLQGIGEKHVLCYAPLPGEINVLSLVTDPTLSACTFYLPKIQPKHAMSFHQYKHGDTLIQHSTFGVDEPLEETPTYPSQTEQPTLLLVPALAIGLHGHRLGYGQGYYDRWLAKANPSTALTSLGVCADVLCTHALPHDAWDQPLDGRVSESGLQFFNKTTKQ